MNVPSCLSFHPYGSLNKSCVWRLCSAYLTSLPSPLLPVATSSALFQTHLSTPQAERLPPLYRHQVYHTLRITVQSKKTEFLCPGTPWALPVMLGPNGPSNLAGKKTTKHKGKPSVGIQGPYCKVPPTGRALKCSRYSEKIERAECNLKSSQGVMWVQKSREVATEQSRTKTRCNASRGGPWARATSTRSEESSVGDEVLGGGRNEGAGGRQAARAEGAGMDSRIRLPGGLWGARSCRWFQGWSL